MVELSTLARPYAKAVFEYAVARGDLQSWFSMLGLMAEVTSQPAVGELLDSPVFTTQQQTDKLIEILGDEISPQGVNLIRVLSGNRRLSLLPEIYRQYSVLKANREKSLDVEMITASEIDSELQIKLAGALSTRLEREINLKVSVDKALIGGAMIRAGDTIIDGSLRGRLGKLAEALNS